MTPQVTTGIVQMATPTIKNELFQFDQATAGQLARGADDQRGLLDAASPLAIPAIPTTEAPYDGEVCFGVFVTDIALDG